MADIAAFNLHIEYEGVRKETYDRRKVIREVSTVSNRRHILIFGYNSLDGTRNHERQFQNTAHGNENDIITIIYIIY